MLCIQLLYGYVKNNNQVQFNLPKNYEESFYLNEVPHLTNRDPAVENNLINLIKNRDDLKKWLLATGDYGKEIQDDLNAIVGYDEKFTNAIVRHSLDLKDEAIFRNPNPINVTFHDMKKFDLVNPVIGKLATQVKASKLTDYELTKKLLMQGEIDALQNRFDRLKYDDKKDDDDNNTRGGRGGGEGGPGTPGPGPPKTPQQEMEEITRRLDKLCGNTQELSPYNNPAQNARIIMQRNNQKFLDKQMNQLEKELKNIPKGIVNKRKSSLNFRPKLSNFRFPDTPLETPQNDDDYWRDVEQNWLGTPAPSFISGLPPAPFSTSPPLFDYDRDFPPISKFVPQPPEPRETRFLYPDKSLSPLQNKLLNIAPLPSRPSVDNISRPITKMADESNNTISIMTKKPVVEPIRQKQLSEQLQQIFSRC